MPVEDYDSLIREAADLHGVDPELIRAVIDAESTGNPVARSSAGARGLMQLMPPTAREMGVKNIHDPRQNIMGGTKYLSSFLKRFDGDVRKALAAYNAGPSRVVKHGGVPPIPETQRYVQKVMGNMPSPTPMAPPPVHATIEIPSPRQPQPAPAPPPPPMPRFSRNIVSEENMPLPLGNAGLSSLLQGVQQEEPDPSNWEISSVNPDEVSVTATPEELRIASEDEIQPLEGVTGDTLGDMGYDASGGGQGVAQSDIPDEWGTPFSTNQKLLMGGGAGLTALLGMLLGGGRSNASYALGGLAKGFAEGAHGRITEERTRSREKEDAALQRAQENFSELQSLDIGLLQQVLTPSELQDIQSAYATYTQALSKGKLTPRDADTLSLAFYPLKGKIEQWKQQQKMLGGRETELTELRMLKPGLSEDEIGTEYLRKKLGPTRSEYENDPSLRMQAPAWAAKIGRDTGVAREERLTQEGQARVAQGWQRLQMQAQQFGLRADQIASAQRNTTMRPIIEDLLAQGRFSEVVDLVKSQLGGIPTAAGRGIGTDPAAAASAPRMYNQETGEFE